MGGEEGWRGSMVDISGRKNGRRIKYLGGISGRRSASPKGAPSRLWASGYTDARALAHVPVGANIVNKSRILYTRRSGKQGCSVTLLDQSTVSKIERSILFFFLSLSLRLFVGNRVLILRMGISVLLSTVFLFYFLFYVGRKIFEKLIDFLICICPFSISYNNPVFRV